MTVPLTDRPSAPQAYQCKITQPTGMATQMQLEVILAGNHIANRILWSRLTTEESIKTKRESRNCFCILVVLSFKLRLIVMSTNLEYREKVGDRLAKRNEKKSNRELEQKIRSYLLEEQCENFLAAVRKWEILAATKVKMSKWKKVNNNRYDISSIKHLSRKLWSCKTMAKKRTKKVCCTCKVVFLLFRPIVAFSPFLLPFYCHLA